MLWVVLGGQAEFCGRRGALHGDDVWWKYFFAPRGRLAHSPGAMDGVDDGDAGKTAGLLHIPPARASIASRAVMMPQKRCNAAGVPLFGLARRRRI